MRACEATLCSALLKGATFENVEKLDGQRIPDGLRQRRARCISHDFSGSRTLDAAPNGTRGFLLDDEKVQKSFSGRGGCAKISDAMSGRSSADWPPTKQRRTKAKQALQAAAAPQPSGTTLLMFMEARPLTSAIFPRPSVAGRNVASSRATRPMHVGIPRRRLRDHPCSPPERRLPCGSHSIKAPCSHERSQTHSKSSTNVTGRRHALTKEPGGANIHGAAASSEGSDLPSNISEQASDPHRKTVIPRGVKGTSKISRLL